MCSAKSKKANKNKKKSANIKVSENKGKIVLPYVQGVTERIARTLKSYNIDAAMKPHILSEKSSYTPKTNATRLTSLMPSMKPHGKM